MNLVHVVLQLDNFLSPSLRGKIVKVLVILNSQTLTLTNSLFGLSSGLMTAQLTLETVVTKL